MIQKYLSENILLIPNVIYKERESYDFYWTVDSRFKLTGYNAVYSFDKPGEHKVELKIVDKVTQISSIYKNVVNVVKLEQKYVSPVEEDLGFGLSSFGIDAFGGVY